MLKGWKTFAFGLLVAISGPVLSYLESVKQALGECGTDAAGNAICSLPGWITLLIGGAIIGLRFLTTTSIFKK